MRGACSLFCGFTGIGVSPVDQLDFGFKTSGSGLYLSGLRPPGMRSTKRTEHHGWSSPRSHSIVVFVCQHRRPPQLLPARSDYTANILL